MRAHDDPSPAAHGLGNRPDRPIILFVDDDPLILRSMRRLFGDTHDIQTAQSGPEALALLAKGPLPAVALIDHQMPGMTGIDLLHALHHVFHVAGYPASCHWHAARHPGKPGKPGHHYYIGRMVCKVWAIAGTVYPAGSPS